MGKRAWAAVVALALMQTASACAEDCRLVELASFDIGPDEAVIIPVTINGTEIKFLVDTGGAISTISPDVIATLHLEQRRIENGVEFYLSDGTLLNKFVQVDELFVGHGKAKHVPLIVQPQQSRAHIERFQGTLAPDFLPNFDLDFDFGHNKFNLMSTDHCKGQVVYWTDAYAEIPFHKNPVGHIEIPVTLDGVETTATIDTGADHTVMSQGMAHHKFDLAPGEGLDAIPQASNESLVQYMHRFKTLDLNGVVVQNPLIGILPDDMAKSFRKHHHDKSDFDSINSPQLNSDPLIIGMDVLRKLHLYIDYKEKILYVTGAQATRDAEPVSSAAPAASQ